MTRLILALAVALACAVALTACRTSPPSHGAPPAPVPTTSALETP